MTNGPVGATRADLPRLLARRLRPAALAIGVLIGIVAPALIWHFQIQAARESAETHARDFERHLQSFIVDNGPLWRYQAQKYLETLRRFLPEKEIRHITVTDEQGAPMKSLEYVAEPVPGEWPHLPVHAAVPVRFNNRVIATIDLEVSTAHATKNVVRLGVVLGGIGIAFGFFMFALPVSVARRLDRQVQVEMRARTALYLAAEEHLAQTRRLALLTREVASTLDSREAAVRAVRHAETLFGARAVRLWRADPDTLPTVAVGPAATEDDVARAAAVLASGKPRREAHADGGERWTVPLVAGHHCAGVLDLTTGNVVTAAETELIGLFATKVAIALVNCELHEGMRRALDQVTEQNAELDSFVHTVSHDLKAPLVAIRGFTGALEEALPPDADPAIKHYATRIEKNVDHMSRLLRDLLEISQVGRANRTAEIVPLGPIVRAVLADLQEEIDARGITVVVGELGAVWGVRAELESVLQNLVGNAVKYLGDVPDPRVEIGCHWHDGVPEYFVRDNGIGIEPAYHEKIFRLFERLQDIHTAGTGVGLAIVRRVVDRAGGRVRVESERGHGATFSFTWPRPAPASSPVVAPALVS